MLTTFQSITYQPHSLLKVPSIQTFSISNSQDGAGPSPKTKKAKTAKKVKIAKPKMTKPTPKPYLRCMLCNFRTDRNKMSKHFRKVHEVKSLHSIIQKFKSSKSLDILIGFQQKTENSHTK